MVKQKKWYLIGLGVTLFLLTCPVASFGEQIMTRSQFAQRINEIMGYTDNSGVSFIDDTENDPSFLPLLIGKKAGYLSGDVYGNGNPDLPVSRAMAAVMCVKVLGWDTRKVSFSSENYNKDDYWSAPSIEVLLELGIEFEEQNLNGPINSKEAEKLFTALENISGLSKDNPYQVRQTTKRDNFYSAVNNNWLISHRIDNNNRSVSVYSILEQQIQQDIHDFIAQCVKTQQQMGSDRGEWKIGQLYQQYMDMGTRNMLGLSQIAPYLNEIEHANTKVALLTAIGNISKDLGISILFHYAVLPDEDNGTRNILIVSPPRLTLGDLPEIYLSKDEVTSKMQVAFVKYVSELLKATGVEQAQAVERSYQLLLFERDLAQIKQQGQAVQAKVVTSAELKQMGDTFLLPTLEKTGFRKLEKIRLENPDTILFINQLFKDGDLELLKDYSRIVLLDSFSSMLNSDLKRARETFERDILGNSTKSDGEKAIEFVGSMLDGVVEKNYAKQNVTQQEIDDINLIVKSILNRYKKLIDSSSWMTDSAKERAKKKLDRMEIKIAWPENWKSYQDVDILGYEKKGTLFDSYCSVYEAQKERQISDLLKPAESTHWFMSTCTVNAVYTPVMNDITIPAALLQEPFYHFDMSREEKLGGIGIVIAHEISHALFGEGAMYDEVGKRTSWWNRDDWNGFQKKINQIITYYSNIELMPEVYVNGEKTALETAADLSAMQCILEVLKEERHYDGNEFFTAYAKCFAMKESDSSIMNTIYRDNHNPMVVRVNHVVNMFQEFYDLYEVKPQNEMYLSKNIRIHIWD